MWLSRQVRARQQTLRLALPDALDLLVICMEAGLGLDQALLYVSQELRIAHPELCEEFDLVNAEMHVGKTRMDALRSLATRTGVDDIQALVATLIQTDRFGTSVAQTRCVSIPTICAPNAGSALRKWLPRPPSRWSSPGFVYFSRSFCCHHGSGSDHHDSHAGVTFIDDCSARTRQQIILRSTEDR